jgi:hypothetical protein
VRYDCVTNLQAFERRMRDNRCHFIYLDNNGAHNTGLHLWRHVLKTHVPYLHEDAEYEHTDSADDQYHADGDTVFAHSGAKDPEG